MQCALTGMVVWPSAGACEGGCVDVFLPAKGSWCPLDEDIRPGGPVALLSGRDSTRHVLWLPEWQHRAYGCHASLCRSTARVWLPGSSVTWRNLVSCCFCKLELMRVFMSRGRCVEKLGSCGHCWATKTTWDHLLPHLESGKPKRSLQREPVLARFCSLHPKASLLLVPKLEFQIQWMTK